MSGLEIGGLAFAAMLALFALRVPIAVAMLAVGIAGYWALVGWTSLGAALKGVVFYRFASYDLSVVPLFILMGSFATKGGLSQALFAAFNDFFGHRRGGLAIATVGACAGFGAVCGSSLATASTMAQVALPEMRARGYSGALATGTLAAGGTLGILIPPSVVLVIYAIMAEQNLIKLFTAAFIPGLLAALGYVVAVMVTVRLRPGSGPAGPRVPWGRRWRGLARTWQVVLLFLLVIGGIYLGWFTATEAASVGVVATALLALLQRRLAWRDLVEVMGDAAVATSMIFLILLGADLFKSLLAFAHLPDELAAFILDLGLSPLLVLALMLLIYLALGCVMDSLSMILLTVPIFLPVVLSLDYGLTPEQTALWFGILALTTVEMGLITPPVGLNAFIINQAARDVPLGETFKGIVPFLCSDVIRVVLLVLFPTLSLWLVGVVH